MGFIIQESLEWFQITDCLLHLVKAYPASEAHKWLVQPGYLEVENGYVSDNGSYMITIRTDMGSGEDHYYLMPDMDRLLILTVTGEMYDWWFGWHLVDSSRYKLWNPVAHQYAWRTPEKMDWANKTHAERYINAYSFIDEYIGAKSSKLTVQFVDPSELNIDKSKWAEQGIETMVVGNLVAGGMCQSAKLHHNVVMLF